MDKILIVTFSFTLEASEVEMIKYFQRKVILDLNGKSHPWLMLETKSFMTEMGFFFK